MKHFLAVLAGAGILAASPCTQAETPSITSSTAFVQGIGTGHIFTLPSRVIGVASQNDLGDYVIQFLDSAGKPALGDLFGLQPVLAYTILLKKIDLGVGYYDVWGTVDGHAWVLLRSLP
jgi:hypothetical protein